MERIVSLFGEKNEIFEQLNADMTAYAKLRGLEYIWAPQAPFDRNQVIHMLEEADAGIIDVEAYDETVFSRISKRCRLLIRFGVGYDQVDLEAASRYGICIARTTGANQTGVAEMALTQILAAGRQLVRNRKTVESAKWTKNIGNELLGKRVGILGFGNVGQCFAKLISGFDTEILVYDVFHDENTAKKFNARFSTLEEIFSTCDAISVHLPYCAETHHLIGADLLARMKETAVIVCTARGNIIDEEALYAALQAEKIAGAGLDVFSTEPLPQNSRLIGLDNIILTPHVSSQTRDSLKAVYRKAVDIAADFFEGKALEKSDLLNPDYLEYRKK